MEACDAAIDRIEARDGPINAVVVRDFDRARTAARSIDIPRRAGDPRALLGVPMTMKESNDVAGLPTTWGLEQFAGHIVERDGVPAARLRAAGAVILGKTNVPPNLADWQSANPIYGRTVNPHDYARTPGGSSGGAAAALGAGMIPLEIGSDIGGSIRVPAHMCGVFGHKPTFGIVPQEGHRFPGTDGVDTPLAVVGPLARTAADLAAALDVIAGPAGESGLQLALPRQLLKDRRALRVLMLASHPHAGVDESILAAMARVADGLAETGVTVLHGSDALPDLAKAHSTYVKMLLTVLSRGTPGAQTIDAHAWMDILDEQKKTVGAWRRLFDQVDVVIAPVLGTTAFPHQEAEAWQERSLMIDGAKTPFGAQIAWPGMALFAGLPATATPVGVDAEGLPIGLQIMAAPYRDHTAIAMAAMLETLGLAEAVTAPVA